MVSETSPRHGRHHDSKGTLALAESMSDAIANVPSATEQLALYERRSRVEWSSFKELYRSPHRYSSYATDKTEARDVATRIIEDHRPALEAIAARLNEEFRDKVINQETYTALAAKIDHERFVFDSSQLSADKKPRILQR